MNLLQRRVLLATVAAALAAAPAFAAENATLTVSKIKDLSVRIYGFVETDIIADTTGGFTEEQGNNPVPMRTGATGSATAGVNNFAGQQHRTEMSVRNSRLGFDLTMPKTEAGLAPEAVIELDMLGNNATNTQPGTAPGTQTERDFFNNPSLRVRHAYLNLTYKEDWNAKVGQYWSLLGWQPYYFPGEAIVQPGPGQLYRRFAQARITHTYAKLDGWTVESAADLAKPAEMNSGNPEAHAGLRVASTKYKAASVGGAGTSMVGLSAAVSGALIPLQTAGAGNPTAGAYAFDFSVPIIPSTDGKDRSNTLIWMGEVMSGSGVGGLEFSGLTLGVPGIGAPAAGSNTGSAIDSGIAGVNIAGGVEPIRYRTFRTHVQYSLPGGKWALSSGYAQVEGRNLDRFANTTKTEATLIPKIQFGYVSAFYDAAAWLRFAAEVNQTRDTYNDAANRHATNNRYQFSTFFIF
jgi:hypothetical protein